MFEEEAQEILSDDDEEQSTGLFEEEAQKIRDPTPEVQHSPDIHFGSSTDMSEVDDESVHLIVTSPPYNADWPYGSVDDDLDYGSEYLPMLAEVFQECYRVLVPGGRMCVNVPSLLRGGTEGGTPIGADIEVMLDTSDQGLLLRYEGDQFEIGELKTKTEWVEREHITWFKGFNTDGLAPNGSFPRPWGILLNNMHEVVLVFQKPGNRDVSTISEQRIEESKINKRNDDLCDDVWHISPEAWSFNYIEDEKVPVFPEELVRRCLTIWTYKGDTVLDPFAGRFTVGKVAKEMERQSIGYELREDLKQDIEEYTGMNQTGLDQW